MKTVREQILEAISNRTGARRALEVYDARDLPITVMVEGSDQAVETPYGMTAVTMPVTIARAIPLPADKSDEWLTDANYALGELIREIYAGDDDTLGGLCQGLDYSGGTVEVLTDGTAGAAVQAAISVRFQFAHGNPFLTTEE